MVETTSINDLYQINIPQLERMLLIGREQLADRNDLIKKMVFKLSRAKHKYTLEYCKKRAYYINEGDAVSKAEALAKGDYAKERAHYLMLEVMMNAEQTICKNIQSEINSVQSVLASKRKELEGSV